MAFRDASENRPPAPCLSAVAAAGLAAGAALLKTNVEFPDRIAHAVEPWIRWLNSKVCVDADEAPAATWAVR